MYIKLLLLFFYYYLILLLFFIFYVIVYFVVYFIDKYTFDLYVYTVYAKTSEFIYITSAKLVVGVGRIRSTLVQLVQSPAVIGHVLVVFGVDRVQLPLRGRLREQRV